MTEETKPVETEAKFEAEDVQPLTPVGSAEAVKAETMEGATEDVIKAKIELHNTEIARIDSGLTKMQEQANELGKQIDQIKVKAQELLKIRDRHIGALTVLKEIA